MSSTRSDASGGTKGTSSVGAKARAVAQEIKLITINASRYKNKLTTTEDSQRWNPVAPDGLP